MKPLRIDKWVSMEISEVNLGEDEYIQIHAGEHTVEIKCRADGKVIVCVSSNDIIVTTFDKEYG